MGKAKSIRVSAEILSFSDFYNLCESSFKFLINNFSFKIHLKRKASGYYLIVYKNSKTALEIDFDIREQIIFISLHKLIDGKFMDYTKCINYDADAGILHFGIDDLIDLRAPDMRIEQVGYPNILSESKARSILKSYASFLKEHATQELQGSFPLMPKIKKIIENRKS